MQCDTCPYDGAAGHECARVCTDADRETLLVARHKRPCHRHPDDDEAA